jgi:hypothetical protein
MYIPSFNLLNIQAKILHILLPIPKQQETGQILVCCLLPACMSPAVGSVDKVSKL